MNSGFVKIYRSLLKWEWHDDPCMISLFIHLILLANYEDTKWHGMVIKRGQVLTTIRPVSNSKSMSLCTTTGCSIYQIRSRLKKLENCGVINIKSTNKFTIITICNYDSYQDGINGNQTQTAHKQHTNSTQTKHIIKEEKEYKENKEYICATQRCTVFQKPTISDVKSYIALKGYTDVDAEQWYSYYESNGWKVGRNPMKNWHAAIATWHRSNVYNINNGKSKTASTSDAIKQRAFELISGKKLS